MRNDLKKKLDVRFKKERQRNIAFTAIAITFFLSFALLFFPFSSKYVQVQGIAVQLSARQTELGSKLFMLVRLGDGKIVKASMQRKLPFHEGAKVVVLMKDTSTPSYQLLRYAKE